MQQRYTVKTIRLRSGERFPLLLNSRSRMPQAQVADYSLTYHRSVPANTSKRAITAIGMFHSWAERRGIDLDARFGTGNLFNSDEVTSLAESLWERRPANAVEPSVNMPPRSVVGATHGYRVDEVFKYLRWRTSQIVSSLAVHDSRIHNINDRLAGIENQLRSLKGSSVSNSRGQLTPEQCLRLFEIVRPGAPENPFHRDTQLRNFFLLLMYYELGVRKAEPLVLKGSHLKFGNNPLITITYTPNDVRDPRRDQPSVKTVSRTLPMSRLLASTADRLLRDRATNRKISAAARKSPFVILDSKLGQPLSLDATYDIFVVIRRRFPDDFPPDFASHHLRRTWNYQYSLACEANGVEEKYSDPIRRYIMGWSKTSVQPENYNQKYIEQQAFKILLGMQDSLTGIEL